MYKKKEDLKKRLEVANIKKEELLNKLGELQKELYQLEEKNKELEEKLKLVDVQNRKLKDELGKSKRAEQQTYEDTELVISENCKTMQGLHAKLQKLEQKSQEVGKFYMCKIENQRMKLKI
ncbi:hypothetical protein [Wolbachia endosymbiont of Mansonella perstans]|uniref:hypothetical protein n=1 Tax=Wolbachia endosymbiont of Mansonella perstans TaxID=229526 RepID=UPI001CE0325A|nr:hypothetical protein [Wolbachia endosymbiont of Mansonella perstans]MCA4774010.1 hypothetical protein [Wolbachia endosymbiont of Mansonella perstans]